MRHVWMAGLALMSAMAVSGCVSDKKYHEALADADLNKDGAIAAGAPRKTFAQAAWQIVIADVSMSLDNVLAVAGAAREHPTVLIMGLALSVVLMGVAASWIAGLLNRHRWIGWAGLFVIVYVALNMIYHGWEDIAAHAFAPAAAVPAVAADQ